EAAVAPIAALALSHVAGAAGLPRGTGPRPGSFLGPQASSLLRPCADAVADSESDTDSARTVALGTETGMGIVETSLTPVVNPAPATGSGRAGSRPVWDACDLLEKSHQLGGSGIQAELNGDLKKLRARAEQLGMWVEGMVSVPRNRDTAAFEQGLIQARTAGATVVRTALLGGRRYESFNTLEDWSRWVDQSRSALRAVVPLLERYKITLAIENHKDWT